MKLVLAADSAGKPLLDVIAAHLAATPEHEVIDLSSAQDGGAETYAGITDRAAQAILDGRAERGIFFCGTGIGVCISANKVAGIRAALTHDTYSADRAARSNDAHVITLGARVVGPELAKSIVDTWLTARFDPEGPSVPNVQGIDALDAKYRRAG